MTKLMVNDGRKMIERTFNSKAQRFQPVAGTGLCDPKIMVGPGQYDP
jgi:hypothetical protein